MLIANSCAAELRLARPEAGDNGIDWRKIWNFFDFGTIFFLVAAVVIFFQLRNVLGRRTGNERPPFDPYTAARHADKDAAAKPGNVVSLPRKRGPASKRRHLCLDRRLREAGQRTEQGAAGDSRRRPLLRSEDLRRRRQDGLRDDRHGLCRRRPQDAEEPVVAGSLRRLRRGDLPSARRGRKRSSRHSSASTRPISSRPR